MDSLALQLPTKHTFVPLMDLCNSFLGSPEPHVRKAAVAALGVMSEGCAEPIKARLADILPKILQVGCFCCGRDSSSSPFVFLYLLPCAGELSLSLCVVSLARSVFSLLCVNPRFVRRCVALALPCLALPCLALSCRQRLPCRRERWPAGCIHVPAWYLLSSLFSVLALRGLREKKVVARRDVSGINSRLPQVGVCV